MSRKQANHGAGSGFKRLLGWTVLLALVFSAGLITGERLVRKESLKPLVAIDDQVGDTGPDTAGDAAEAKPTSFAFFDQLTRKTDVSLSAAKKPASQKKGAEQPKAKKSAAAPDKQAGQKAEKSAAEKPAAEKAAPQPAENQQAERAADNAASAPDAAARYTLQVAAHPVLDEAKEHMERLRKMGLQPHLVSAAIPGKGEFYRVRVGKFSSMEEARAFQTSLKAKNSLNTFVSPL